MTGQKTPTALGTEKIGKLLMQYAIPAIIAMTASSLYNMVDSIFIGHGVGPMAISGLALTFPLMNLAAAFGSLVGVGAATLVSVKLGQKDYDTAQRVLGNVLVLNIIIGLAFTILTLIFLDPILYFFGGSDETVGYARDYMNMSSACVPCSATRPCSNTTTWSASAAFAMRCVTMITVLPRSASARMVCRIRVSLSTSTLLVASSKM